MELNLDQLIPGEKQDAQLTAQVQYKLLRGNAERLYSLTPATPPATTRV